jgi:hypothetical protein
MKNSTAVPSGAFEKRGLDKDIARDLPKSFQQSDIE